MAEESKKTESAGASSFGEILESLPLDELKQNFTDYVSAWSDKAIGGMGDKVSGLIENLGSGDGASGAMGKAAQEGAKNSPKVNHLSKPDYPVRQPAPKRKLKTLSEAAGVPAVVVERNSLASLRPSMLGYHFPSPITNGRSSKTGPTL